MPRTPSEMVRVNLNLTKKQLAAVRGLAKRRGNSYSEEIRHAVNEHLLREVARERDSNAGISELAGDG